MDISYKQDQFMASRRDFIRISGLGLGGLAVSASGYSIYQSLAASPPKGSELTLNTSRTPTYCEICFWKCAGWVYKNDEGKIWKVIGNDEDQHSNGRFCPRGTGGPGMYYDEDRLKTPLIRIEERGKQVFREASWDEALDLIADKMKGIAREHGPECVALLTHGSGGKYFGTMLKAFGSSSIAAPSYAQCRGPREVAYFMTFGEGVGSPERTDIRDTDCLVLIGSHLGENMHNGQVQEMSDAIDKGASIITVDPRYSIAASKSKYWLPIKPATDLALLLSWIHVIIYEGWYDREYVDKYTYGFEQLKAHVRNMTPEWAYGITTITPDLIRKSAKEMADAAPAVIIHPGRHVTWYGDDTQRSRATAILNALLGSWGRRGGFYNPEAVEIPDWPHPPFPVPRRSWKDAYPQQFNLAYETIASGICDATIPEISAACNFKGWIVNGTNLLKTIPDSAKTIEAIQNLDLLVVIDTMPMDITGWADVILPECTYLERYDTIRDSPHRKPAIALRMPATEPLYNTKPAYWIARELAKRLDLEDYFSWNSIEEMLEWQLNQVGTTLEEMQRIGVKTFERTYDDLYFQPGQEVEFDTNTGKIELYSTSLAAEGFDPLPVYTPHEEPPEGYYRLNYGRAPMHTFGRTANNALLKDLMEENTVWINPKVAGAWGITNGQYLWLENQDGIRSSFPIRARITERIRWDSVYMVHGFGHTDKKLSRAYGKGASDSELITRVHVDPIMGGTGMRGNFVTFKFEPANEEVQS
jgi:thiosulfate reductase/polysulfide reductase chain A